MAVTVACLIAIAGCSRLARRSAGRLDAAWTGSDRGRMAAPASAIWCREARIAQLSGLVGDTGVSLLVYPADSLVVGRYRIVEPDSTRSGSAVAAVGLRLLGPTAVVGYQSLSGWITIERAKEGRVSGRFQSTAKIVTALAGTIQLEGVFRDVPLAPGGAACPS